jgi:peroxiredoxin
VAEHGIQCAVLLQDEMKLAAEYRAQGTPMGYRIDAAGRIASELTIGAEQLLQIASAHLRPNRLPDVATGRSAHSSMEPDPSLARSRLNRNGLKAGTPAPSFQLPAIAGGELALEDLRGQRVLLVFSDPDCGPCDELAPQLQQLHAERSDLQVLVISRRDPEATLAKAETLGLTYPIVMQKQWELSLKYGMFATPIGYLIDEQGVLLSNVAVGVGPILDLARLDQRAATDLDGSAMTNGRLLTAK